MAGVLAGCQQSKELKITEMVQSERDCYYQAVEPQMADSAAETLVIDMSMTDQTLKGFGTCFNELGWASLQLLPEETLQGIFRELFTAEGANFNRGRMSMGANDFALDYYSPDDTEGDFELRDFSIERDKQTLIPMMKMALQANPDIYWFASPWCPPRWMKKTGHYAEKAITQEIEDAMKQMWDAQKQATEPGVSATTGFFSQGPLAFRLSLRVNDAKQGEEGYEGGTSFRMEPEYLDAYARLFGRFCDAYKAEGIDIRMVMPQNEMSSAQPYPSCCWTHDDLRIFVGQYLGPEMAKHGVDVYFGTEERPDPLMVDTILDDAEAGKYVKGVAFQWAGKESLPIVRERHPEMDLVESEQECGNGLNNWEGAMHSWDLQRHYLNNGVTQYYYWNTSLFYDKPSRWGWYQNSLITVNEADGSWTYTPEYYELKHLSHYAHPGAKRLILSGTHDDALAFLNPDGTVALIVCNQSDAPEAICITMEGKQATLQIAANSISSMLLK